MLISNNSSGFINVSGQGQVQQDPSIVLSDRPDDKYIVVEAVGVKQGQDGAGIHIKTHSSASDYMEFENDRPVVGYSPSSRMRNTDKQGESGQSKPESFKDRLA